MARLRASSKANVDVEAKAIGRTREGSPLASKGQCGGLNDFTYDDDPEGLKTPHFAHIRKMNPRDNGLFRPHHRLLRRGIPFGPPAPEGAPDDKVERGLLFNAFMASIEDQFEFVQRRWASNPGSLPATPTDADGPDPVAGASDAPCFLRRGGRGTAGDPFRAVRADQRGGVCVRAVYPDARQARGVRPAAGRVSLRGRSIRPGPFPTARRRYL